MAAALRRMRVRGGASPASLVAVVLDRAMESSSSTYGSTSELSGKQHAVPHLYVISSIYSTQTVKNIDRASIQPLPHNATGTNMLNRLSVGTKLGAAFALVLILMIGVGAFSIV